MSTAMLLWTVHSSRKNVNRNRSVNPIKRVVGALIEGLDVLTVLLSRS